MLNFKICYLAVVLVGCGLLKLKYAVTFYCSNQVMKSIKDNITEDVLLNEIQEIISLPMYADRIKSDSRAQKKGKPPPQRKM